MIIAWQYAEINERLRPFRAMARGRTMKAESGAVQTFTEEYYEK